MSRFEIVHTDTGWHARFVGRNGKVIWWTEKYTTKRRCTDGLRLLVAPLDSAVTRVGVRTLHDAVPPVEIRYVDERCEVCS